MYLGVCIDRRVDDEDQSFFALTKEMESEEWGPGLDLEYNGSMGRCVFGGTQPSADIGPTDTKDGNDICTPHLKNARQALPVVSHGNQSTSKTNQPISCHFPGSTLHQDLHSHSRLAAQVSHVLRDGDLQESKKRLAMAKMK